MLGAAGILGMIFASCSRHWIEKGENTDRNRVKATLLTLIKSQISHFETELQT